jgi:hypothetical protein
MLIGLLRCPHGSSIGLWYLLYQQVVPYLSLPLTVDILQVHHLVFPGGNRRNSTYSLSSFVTL